jgi:hypothetical protein
MHPGWSLRACKVGLWGRCELSLGLSRCQVFISEQEVYSKSDLQRHMHQGDLIGPLAESGFKGHPSCRFCRRQFYGESELFFHMQQRHEQCFICKRANPDKYVYYRDYAELEGAGVRCTCMLCTLCACIRQDPNGWNGILCTAARAGSKCLIMHDK